MFREILDRDVVANGATNRTSTVIRRARKRLKAAWLYRKRTDMSARPKGPGQDLLLLYLDRHIELDEGAHGPMAAELLMHLCGNDEEKWREATESAQAALEARHRMWDGVAKALVKGPAGASEEAKAVIDLASRRAHARSS